MIHSTKMTKDNIYDEDAREEQLENDELDPSEDGVVRGYEEDDYKPDEE